MKLAVIYYLKENMPDKAMRREITEFFGELELDAILHLEAQNKLEHTQYPVIEIIEL